MVSVDFSGDVQVRRLLWLVIVVIFIKTNPLKAVTCFEMVGLQVSIVGLERALYAYVKDASHSAPFDLKTVPLATTPMQDQVVKAGKPGEISHILIHLAPVVQRTD